MAVAPREVADLLARDDRNDPTGVRAAPIITTFYQIEFINMHFSSLVMYVSTSNTLGLDIDDMDRIALKNMGY